MCFRHSSCQQRTWRKKRGFSHYFYLTYHPPHHTTPHPAPSHNHPLTHPPATTHTHPYTHIQTHTHAHTPNPEAFWELWLGDWPIIISLSSLSPGDWTCVWSHATNQNPAETHTGPPALTLSEKKYCPGFTVACYDEIPCTDLQCRDNLAGMKVWILSDRY